MDDSNAKASFSGRTRQRKTKPSVLIANKVAATVITIGGISTVLAVTLVCVFLVSVVVPVFFPPEVEGPFEASTGFAVEPEELPLHRFELNEYQTLAVRVTQSGMLEVFHLRDGQSVSRERLFGERKPLNMRFVDNAFVGGFADGTVQTGSLTFETTYVLPENIPDDLKERLKEGSQVFEEGVVELTPENQYRKQSVSVELKDPALLEEGAEITKVDLSMKLDSPIIAAVSSTGTLHLKEVDIRTNMLTGKTSVTLYGGSLRMEEMVEKTPLYVLLAGLGDNVFLIWEDGRMARVDSRQANDMSVVEEENLLGEGGSKITLAEFLIGKTSLVVGDDAGNVNVWFRTKPEDATAADGADLVNAISLEPMPGEVLAMTTSARNRKVVTADDRGNVNLYYVTNHRTLAKVEEPALAEGVYGLALSPKDDGLYALAPDGLFRWDLDIPHPEVNLKQVFGKVWYEGYNEPAHVWQSSSGTDDFEPKYGLWPLIFGTIKATAYSLLFGVPLALLAAVYTSEIMEPKLRSRVKPTIEMMASLPSVVLGFLAALVIAPMVENFVPSLLISFVTIPFALLAGAYLWQLLPHYAAAKFHWARIPAMLAAFWVGIRVAGMLGPGFESWFFLGNIKLWLSTREGAATGGWMILFMPLCGILWMYLNARWITPWMKRSLATTSRINYVLVDLGRFLATSVAAIATALAISSLLSAMGIDARGGYIDTYVQRNALIVGFIMGFAIIPIIYTLSEDALSAVPENLRAASLGAGATPWQTATRIIIPTAASGFFSAVMIGFGRAVGETMIVLMAAGNTAVLEWNMFNGFRTLSANIAVELPEAVQDSTHYRMLYMAALSLFVMTFVLNSLAESIRQRFRKRAFEL